MLLLVRKVAHEMSKEISSGGHELRSKILKTASDLFYAQGIRAVGVDLVVEKAGVAKTSLYRYFGTKDDLIVAFLKSRDEDFWKNWDRIAESNKNDPHAELIAQLKSIAETSCKTDYRGCPQLNAVTEFPDVEHPGHKFARAHKRELRRRLKQIVEKISPENADALSLQLTLLINGACVNTPSEAGEMSHLLTKAADALISA
jgi:AcrR family transcriptional regulator